MLRIRLTRKGKKRQPSYRVVVADVESPRDGRYVEQIGYFDPMRNPEVVNIEEARALHWLSVGAQPSDAVRRLLKNQGTYDRLKRLRAGEELDALVAEYAGEEYTPAAVEEAAPVVEEVVEAAPEPKVVEEPAVEEAPAVEEVAVVAEEPVVEEVAAVVEAEPAKPDDLKKIEGIGPKVAGLLNDAGIMTYADLAAAEVATISGVLAEAGGVYASMVPDTWPQQAALAEAGNWDELTALQDKLDGGRVAS